MKRFEKLSQEDKNEIICRAWEWRQKHSAHVDRMVENQQARIAPSGSDLTRPELWKAAHWAWFDRGGE
jgi:hypothetical protein